MDPKASAKSKRSYSQHAKRNTRPITANAQSKKPQQSGDQKSAPLYHPLPSNWDRYEETVAEDGGETVAPKSKGADYNYLIEQAQTQPIEGPFSLDYAIPGLSPMLSARGESLLSWCGDDSFIVDEDATSSYEVPFLSMDLHALAAQLAKLSMSQRLFIEEDLLPAELDVDGPNESNTVESANLEASKSESKLSLVPQKHAEKVTGSQIDSSRRYGTVEEHGISERTGKEVGSHKLSSHVAMPPSSGHGISSLERVPLLPKSTSLDTEIDELIAETISLGPSGLGDSLSNYSTTQYAVSSRSGLSSSDPHVGTSASIDDTIDDLLAETKLFGVSSMVEGLSNSSATQHQLHIHSCKDAAVSSSGHGHSSSSGYVTDASISLDSTIDDLLAEFKLDRSSSGIGGEGLSTNSTTAVKSHDTSILLGAPLLRQNNPCPSKHLAASTVSLDNTVDDLLAETSSHHKDQKNKGYSLPSGNYSGSGGSKAMEDFDSWLDTF